MWTIIFAITTVICATGWLTKHISCMAMIYYITTKGYNLPSEKEIEECAHEAAKHLFK